MAKTKRVRVPTEVYNDIKGISTVFNVSMPKAFTIKDALFAEIIKKKTVRGKKTRIEIELKDI